VSVQEESQRAGRAIHALAERMHALTIRLVEMVAVMCLAADFFVLLWGVVSRYVFAHPIVWGEEVASILFLWLGMLGAVVALSKREHMALSTIVDRLPQRYRPAVSAFASALAAVFLAVMIVPACRYLQESRAVTTPVLGISQSWRIFSLVVGTALMLAVTLIDMARRTTLRQFAGSLVIVVVAGLASWFLRPLFDEIGNYSLVFFFVAGVALAVAAGVPIGFAFGLATFAYLFFTSSAPLSVVVGRMDEGMSHLILLGIPMFVLVGGFIQMTGMARAMVEFLASVLGGLRGGLSYVLLAAMYLVSGISGSKAADMAAVAPALFPEMKERGAHPGELVALLSSSGAMSETIPPSLVLIAVGSVTGISIAALFEGGMLPAVVLALVLAVVCYFRASHTENVAHPDAPASRIEWKKVLKLFAVALPALALPFLIRSFVIEGVATATEVSTVGIVYVLIAGIVIYRSFDIKMVYPVMVQCVSLSGAILLIIGTATAMAWALTQSGFSTDLAELMQSVPGGKVGFLAISIVVFVILGSVLEGIPAIVLFGPLLFPIAQSMHIDPVHYAMVVVLAMGIGLFCPPFGVGYYAACAIGRVHPSLGLKRVWPYMYALVAGLIVVAAVPWFSTAFRR
jgi:tripartite ATP-independent transporter DctM subunit